MQLISTRLLPDRHRSTLVARVDNEHGPHIVKKFFNYDNSKLWAHFEWIKKINLPFAPKIESINTDLDALQIMYKEVPGKPLWSLIEEKGHFYVFERCLGLIEQLKEFSDTYFVNKLPPNTGIIHADFHMGNIIDNNNFLSIVDIENICIGNYDQMRREIALNIIGDPLFIIDKTDSAIELIIKNLCIDETTFSSHHDDIKKVINHFYDYYRDKKNYFEKEKSLREILIESSLKKELPKI